jgi:hypothetical protein
MRKLNKEVKQGIRDACLAFSEKDAARVCAEYAISLLESIDQYPHWYEEEKKESSDETV